MTTIIRPNQGTAQEQPGSRAIGCLVGVGLILFGGWFGFNKTVEFAHERFRDQDAIDQAEMQMLQGSMNCEDGEVLEIRPLGDRGAKSVRCVAGPNMPPVRRQAEGEQRG
jgi:hypothetical protein